MKASNAMNEIKKDEANIRGILEDWAKATSENRKDDILKNHRADLVIFDVPAPMKYDSAEAYCASWGDWQPETEGDGQFELEDLKIAVGSDVSVAHCFIRCGGQTPEGGTYHGLVRATFCLARSQGLWKVFHQHISKPIEF